MPRVAVAATTRLSADAGAEIAAIGGNAVDAVIASVVSSMCTDIGIVSPGGGAFVTIAPPGEAAIVIDGCPEMPGRGAPASQFGLGSWDIAFDYKGETHQVIGYGSVATPGAFAALGEASKRYGRLPWAELLQPTIRSVENGFPLRGGAAEYLGYVHDSIYAWCEESNRIVHRADSRPIGDGDIVTIPDLADSLREIAAEGSRALYIGEIGRRIATAVSDAGGLLGLEDLAAYRATVHEPLTIDFFGWQVATCPPPSLGGPCMAAMLHLLQARDHESFDATAVNWLVDVQRAVLTFRANTLDGAGEEFTAEADRLIALAHQGDTARLLSSPSTIHVSGVDDDGLACSITSSAGYGSGAIAPGTGIWLNNSLGEVDLHPKGLDNVPPGTRLSSNMAPSVARRADGTVLAIGSPGASRITTAIAQSLWHHAAFGRTLEDAVEFARAHVEPYEGARRVAFEEGLPVAAVDGYRMHEFEGRDMFFGGVQAAQWSPNEGLCAVADPRRNGKTALASATNGGPCD